MQASLRRFGLRLFHAASFAHRATYSIRRQAWSAWHHVDWSIRDVGWEGDRRSYLHSHPHLHCTAWNDVISFRNSGLLETDCGIYSDRVVYRLRPRKSISQLSINAHDEQPDGFKLPFWNVFSCSTRGGIKIYSLGSLNRLVALEQSCRGKLPSPRDPARPTVLSPVPSFVVYYVRRCRTWCRTSQTITC